MNYAIRDAFCVLISFIRLFIYFLELHHFRGQMFIFKIKEWKEKKKLCSSCVKMHPDFIKNVFSCHQFGRPLAGIHFFHFFHLNSSNLCSTRARCQHKIQVKQIEKKDSHSIKKTTFHWPTQHNFNCKIHLHTKCYTCIRNHYLLKPFLYM